MAKRKREGEDLRDDEKLDAVEVDAALIEAGLESGGTAAERAIRLEAYYLALSQPTGWNPKPACEGGQGSWHLLCEIPKGGCGYTSTARQPYCVFCGDGKEEVEQPAATAMVVASKEPEVIEGELVDEGEGLPSPPDEAVGTEQDLNAAVAAINAAKRMLEAGERRVTGAEWDLGKAIFEVFRRTLYLARKTNGGASLYATWPQFCKAELPVGAAQANRYMRIAANFTRELSQELGPSKLIELLPAAEAQAADALIAPRLGREPKVLLPPLIERARVLPVVELRAEVRAAMGPPLPRFEKGVRDSTVSATTAAAAKRLAAKQPEAERVTVQRQEGTVQLRFYADEEAARAADPKGAVKAFADGVVAVEPAVNGVEVVHTLRLDAKLGPVLVRKVIRLAD